MAPSSPVSKPRVFGTPTSGPVPETLVFDTPVLLLLGSMVPPLLLRCTSGRASNGGLAVIVSGLSPQPLVSRDLAQASRSAATASSMAWLKPWVARTDASGTGRQGSERRSQAHRIRDQVLGTDGREAVGYLLCDGSVRPRACQDHNASSISAGRFARSVEKRRMHDSRQRIRESALKRGFTAAAVCNMMALRSSRPQGDGPRRRRFFS